MAVSSTSSSSSTGTASIDVAGIVSQLMTAENKPLDAIKSKITEQQVVISDLGAVKAKVSTFKDALKVFEDPNSYNNSVAATSDSSVVTATAANGSVAGSYKISVEQLAQPSKYGVSDFSSSTAAISVDDGNGFEITVGGTKYSTKGAVTVDGVLSARTVPVLASSPTVSDLKSWINALGVDVKANVVQTTASDQWALTIEGTLPGADNAVTYTGLNTGTLNPDATVVAQNAKFTVNGIAFERSSNAINDAVSGLTINLVSTTSAGSTKTISVSAGANNSEKVIQDLVSAYNDLVTQYRSLTANSANSTTPGTFGNNPTMLAFIGDIKSRFATGFSYGDVDPVTGKKSSMSLASLGMDLQLDGTIKFNSITHAQASSNGLQATLAKGVKVGYVSDTNSLMTFVTSETSFSGALSQQIQAQSNSVADLQKRQDQLQERLATIQNNYISQYSALNALLFQLSSTSNSLTSALDALTNNNSKN
ncbi:flagellar filament capping protein FliD [Polynucleobacter sp. AP-Ainpum-60-G11]|uniref:flagellar filament capping protein FliD n=1 Tax=Polynucleobacter sp. AP-Ainpum-60-G11 TaxID=2576926 RepID=UPI001BFE499B|nr:flagellar filament capping protein FliD [Polynucleobacter sp. AP-Ainpum-60-G11]QWE27146.1 flagellar filament capping protein FliD [Polynucleobacter sp. AP-Ainpum-60-G11]